METRGFSAEGEDQRIFRRNTTVQTEISKSDLEMGIIGAVVLPLTTHSQNSILRPSDSFRFQLTHQDNL